jgi:hypothetical protein
MKQLADLGVNEIEMCSPFGYADFAGLAKGADDVKGPVRSWPHLPERSLQHEGAAGTAG